MSNKLRSAVLAGFCISLFHLALAQDGTWTTKSPMLAPHLSGGTGVVDGELFWAGDSMANSTDVEVYDPTNDSWTTIAALPTATAYEFAAGVGDKFYVIGGCTGQPVDCAATTGAVQIYDSSTGSWSNGISMPTPRNNPAGGVINGKIYVVGGDLGNNTTTNALEVFDPVAGTWATKSPMPTARRDAASAVINGKLYVVGGYSGGCCGTLYGTLEIYDPATDSWTAGAPLPVPTFALRGMGVSLNGLLYVIGGENLGGASSYSGGPTTSSSVVYVYNRANNVWSTVTSIPLAGGIARGSVQDINGIIYIAGGDTVSGGSNVTLSSIESFTPSSTITGLVQLNGGNAFTGNQTVNGSVSATSFSGDGSGLTNVTASGLNCAGCIGNSQLAVNYALGDAQGGNAVNALLLNGLPSGTFAPASGSTSYVAKAGDSMSGPLSVQPPTDEPQLFLEQANDPTAGWQVRSGIDGSFHLYRVQPNGPQCPNGTVCERLTIQNGTGNVGIGTINPTKGQLQVLGNGYDNPGTATIFAQMSDSSAGGAYAGVVVDQDAGPNDHAGYLTVGGHNSGNNFYYFHQNSVTLAATTGAKLYMNAGAQDANSIVIDTAGNVGIRNASPSQALDVGGSIAIGGTPVINASGQWVGSSTSLQGPPGPTGATGPQGPQGTQGLQGPPGPTGASPFTVNGTNASVPLDLTVYSANTGFAQGINVFNPGFTYGAGLNLLSGGSNASPGPTTLRGYLRALGNGDLALGRYNSNFPWPATESYAIRVNWNNGDIYLGGDASPIGGSGPVGNVGIGNSSPTAKLDVSGNINASGGVTAALFSGNGSGLTNVNASTATTATAATTLNCVGCVFPGQLSLMYAGSLSAGGVATNSAQLGGVGASNYARVDVGNSFSGNESISGNLSESGTLTIGGGTPILKHMSILVNPTFPALKSGACATAAFTFTGATDGDTTALGVPNARMTGGGNLIYTAWISATNTVTVQGCNVNASTPQKTVGSGSIRVDLWKH